MSDHTPEHKEKTEQGMPGQKPQGDWDKEKRQGDMGGQREQGGGTQGGERREERVPGGQ